MAYSYTSRNGERVEVNVAAAFDRLNAAFKSRFGLSLVVSSGTRTRAEQQYYYDLYLSGKGNLAAAPGYSNHEEGGPRGPRALDVRDTGSDAGVTVRGTTRANWLRSNAPNYGFDPAGYRFSQIEPWHIEFTGAIGGSGGSTSSGGLAVDGNWGAATTRALQKALGVTQDGILGPATVRALQTKLKNAGHKIAVDGEMGPATVKAMQIFVMGAKHADGKLGPATVRALQSYLNSGGKFNTKNSKPTPPPPAKLNVDGLWGASTTKALQKALGVTQDGELGPKTYTALQKKLVAAGHKIAVDGEFGPATIRALQIFLLGASKADGILGPETVKGLQRYLNSGGTFVVKKDDPKPTTPAPAPSPEKLTVDGEWGPATTKALQRSLGVTVDGELGPNTIKALQKALGTTADGEIGPNTIKALQVAVGSTVDGELGPNTIKALQTFLNAGKKFTKVTIPEDSGNKEPVTYPKPAKPTYPGASWWHHSPNSDPRRAGDKVQYFVIHHVAATSSVAQLRDRFMKPNDNNVSPNWLVGADGSVSEIVPPDKFRAWTSGQFDYNAVTVETQNTSGGPNWGISEESHVAIAKLVAWASKRYGFPIDRKHVIGHREVPGQATICPGPSMDIDKIVRYAKEFANPEAVQPPAPDGSDNWTITLPKGEAEALAGLLDKLRDLLP